MQTSKDYLFFFERLSALANYNFTFFFNNIFDLILTKNLGNVITNITLSVV